MCEPDNTQACLPKYFSAFSHTKPWTEWEFRTIGSFFSPVCLQTRACYKWNCFALFKGSVGVWLWRVESSVGMGGMMNTNTEVVTKLFEELKSRTEAGISEITFKAILEDCDTPGAAMSIWSWSCSHSGGFQNVWRQQLWPPGVRWMYWVLHLH